MKHKKRNKTNDWKSNNKRSGGWFFSIPPFSFLSCGGIVKNEKRGKHHQISQTIKAKHIKPIKTNNESQQNKQTYTFPNINNARLGIIAPY